MKFLFLIFLLPLKLCAQDITGVWTGTLYNDTTKQYLKYELAISEYDGKLSGYSHTIFVIDKIENIGVKSVKVKKSGDQLFIEDDKLIYNNYTEPPAKGVRIYSDLVLSQDDSSMILSGPWKTNITKVYRSITGNILLKKKRSIEETLIIPKLENLGLARSLSFMTYNNYSKDVAINKPPVTNLPVNNKQSEPVETNNYTDNNAPVNSTGKKEIESKLNHASTDTQYTATANKPVLNSQLNKSQEKDIPAKKPSADTKPINHNDNKELPGTIKQATDSSTSNMTYTADQNNRRDNYKTAAGDSGLRKKNDTTVFRNDAAKYKKGSLNKVNKNDREAVKDSSLTAKPGSTKNDVAIVSSIDAGVDKPEIEEKSGQINPVKTLINNNETINANIKPVSKAAADISSRKIETIKSVDIKNDSLLLTLYDNGEIDGDTVSVLLNGKVIMPMQGLTANGISKTIYLTPEMGDSIVLIMYAENLGSIPPNTGLLIVHDGDARHEIWFTGDLHENAAIILRRKKKT